MAEAANPIGIYSAARALLEFAAFAHDVSQRLCTVRDDLSRHWRPRGEEFFGLIVRARFGTSNPTVADLLIKGGISRNHVKPFNIAGSIKALSCRPDFESAGADYDRLCDFVHHNCSSNSVTNLGAFQGTIARSSGGGEIRLPNSTSIVRYQYPAPNKAALALNETAATARKTARVAVDSINQCPETPYSPEELEQMTGNNLGIVRVDTPLDRRQPDAKPFTTDRRVGRNEPCPCGSGKKFKRCCLANGDA
jgi:hypothetical protein